METNEEDSFPLDNEMKATDYYMNLKKSREAKSILNGVNKNDLNDVKTLPQTKLRGE